MLTGCWARQVRNRFYLNKGHPLKGKKEPPGVRGYSLQVAALVRSEEPLTHIADHFPLPPKPPGTPPSLIVCFHVNSETPKQNIVLRRPLDPAPWRPLLCGALRSPPLRLVVGLLV